MRVVFFGFIAIVLAPLFYSRVGYHDLYNNAWIVNYYANQFSESGVFPLLLNNTEIIGDSLPFFYGGLLHSLIALLTIVFDSIVAIKVFLFLLVLGIFSSIFNLIRNEIRFDVTQILTLTTIFAISNYQLTNLYNRSAIAEFAASSILIMGLAIFFDENANNKIKGFLLITSGFILHPLNLILFFIISPLLLIIPFNLREVKKREIIFIFILIIILSLIYFPLISNYEYTKKITSFYHLYSFDNLLERVIPGLIDARLLKDGLSFSQIANETPFLSASLNWGATLYILFSLKNSWRIIYLTIVGATIFFSVGIITLPGYLSVIQFPYRLNITIIYTNIIFLIFILKSSKKINCKVGSINFVIGICFGITLIGNIQKITEVFREYSIVQVVSQSEHQEIFDTSKFPRVFNNGAGSYTKPLQNDGCNESNSLIVNLDYKKISFFSEYKIDISNLHNASKFQCIHMNGVNNPILRVNFYNQNGKFLFNREFTEYIKIGINDEIKFISVETARRFIIYGIFRTVTYVFLSLIIFYLIFNSIYRMVVAIYKFKGYKVGQ